MPLNASQPTTFFSNFFLDCVLYVSVCLFVCLLMSPGIIPGRLVLPFYQNLQAAES